MFHREQSAQHSEKSHTPKRFNQNPFADSKTSEFLGIFSKHSGFGEQIARLETAITAGDEQARQRALDELVEIYLTAAREAPNSQARMYLDEVVFSEFYRKN